MKKFALTLALKDDPQLIKEYEEYHEAVWPAVLNSITDAGIQEMEIYRAGTKLFMTIRANDDFFFERKSEMDLGNTKVQEWEELMWKYQQKIPGTAPDEKWVLMKKIFEL
ncbi:L-rhamnose mutarotase [Pedobacter frigiditerrae]|uniref:L-rhamnose mutarotase n=1 Tax=Pedobacter frigiditerrae TaxID=2530452 RepID=A0A4R0MSW9_9SPHI|nr:L-rhamnose mutarotase [Pedobacter frigiditerrae]TCC89084.1 L-rhamnose mutarotase [Pedobacter frigiditerrae]